MTIPRPSILFTAAACCLGLANPLPSAAASAEPRAARPLEEAKADPAVTVYEYQPDRIYSVRTGLGITTEIELSPFEKILDYSTGFTSGWDLTRRDNVFYLKPKNVDVDTNLMIRTETHSYIFELKVVATDWRTLSQARNAGVQYHIRFTYPADAAFANQNAKAQREPEQSVTLLKGRDYNFNYDYATGEVPAPWLLPLNVWDDGRFTYIKMPDLRQFPTGNFPSVYMRETERAQDSLVNTTVEGNTIVVHGTYNYLIVRHNDRVIALRRKTTPAPIDPAPPTPAPINPEPVRAPVDRARAEAPAPPNPAPTQPAPVAGLQAEALTPPDPAVALPAPVAGLQAEALTPPDPALALPVPVAGLQVEALAPPNPAPTPPDAPADLVHAEAVVLAPPNPAPTPPDAPADRALVEALLVLPDPAPTPPDTSAGLARAEALLASSPPDPAPAPPGAPVDRARVEALASPDPAPTPPGAIRHWWNAGEPAPSQQAITPRRGVRNTCSRPATS